MKELSFEEKLEKLESIVKELESANETINKVVNNDTIEDFKVEE